MPIVRITLKEGKSPEYLAAVSDSVYGAMREHFALPEGDKFHIFEELDSNTFIYDRDFGASEQRTDDFMLIQIVSDARRKSEKTALFKALCERLAALPGVRPQDIAVSLTTTSTLEDASLGDGVAVGEAME